MGLRRITVLALALALGGASFGCKETKSKDESSSDEEESDAKKKKKKKKKSKKADGDDKKTEAKTEASTKPEEKPAVATPKKIETEPPNVDEPSKQIALLLAPKVQNARFAYEDVKEKGNAKAFVHLAATSTNKDVIVASLRAMVSAFTSYEKSTERVMVDEDYARAVLMRLGEADPRIQHAAIRAAAHSLSIKPPHPKVVDAILDLALNHPKPEGRHAAIDALGNVNDLAKTPALLAPFFKAFDAPEAYLASEALQTLKYRLHDAPDKTTLKPKLEALLKHADPGVRGNAAEALAYLAGWDPSLRNEYAALIVPLLDDPNNFTKSAACEALANLRHKKALTKIITFVDDHSANTYDIKGWTELDGDPGWQHHDGSPWSTMSDAALAAIRSLSLETKVKFEYKIDYKTKDEDLKKAAAEAKKWFEQVKGDLG